MRLSLHIIWKDFRRLALPWAVWVLLLVAQQGLAAAFIRGHAFGVVRLYEFNTYQHALGTIQLGFGYLIAAWLMQEDSLFDPDADWMTRPISATRLFWSKLLGSVLMFWIPPVIVGIVSWRGCHYQADQMLRAALETLLVYGLIATSAALVASATRNWLQFLLVTAILAAIYAWMAFVYSHGAVFEHLSIGSAALILLAVGASTYVGFRGRKPWNASGVALVFVLVLEVVSSFHGVNASAISSLPPEASIESRTEALPTAAHFIFESVDILYGFPYLQHLTRNQYYHWLHSLHLIAHASAPRSGTILMGYSSKWELDFPGGMHLQREDPLDVDLSSRSRQAEAEVLGLASKVEPATLTYRSPMRTPLSVIARALNQRPAFRTELKFRLLEGHIKLQIPLKVDSQAFANGRGVRIASIRLELPDDSDGHTSVVVNTAETRASPWGWSEPSHGGPWLSSDEERQEQGRWGIGGYVLVNRAAGEIAFMSDVTYPAQDFVPTRAFGWRTLIASLPRSEYTNTEDKARMWIDQAELVHIVFEPVGSYRTSIEVPNLNIRVQQGRPAGK